LKKASCIWGAIVDISNPGPCGKTSEDETNRTGTIQAILIIPVIKFIREAIPNLE
jgi:hypothetical protein